MEKTKFKDDRTVKIMKFAVLQTLAYESFLAIEEDMIDIFTTEMSTQYRERFTAKGKRKRDLEKEMNENIRSFKARFKAYAKKNKDMLNQMDGIRKKEFDTMQSCVEQMYDFIDELISKEDE